jgi:hypothetical protein
MLDSLMDLPRMTAVLAFALGIAGCSERGILDVAFLASDLYFSIGGQSIVIPAVALRGPDHVFDLSSRKPDRSLKETLNSEAREPSHPMKRDKLDLGIRQYQYTGETFDGINICPLLTRKWSQSLCRGRHRGLLRRLPEKFALLDRTKLDVLKNHWTVGKERQYDQVKDMTMRPGVTEMGCDKESRFCTALVQVVPGLVAVWTVWPDPNTGGTAADAAQSQGSAIVELVRRGLGRMEDPTLVEAD